MALSEKIELLGKGLYGNKIPDTLTLTAIPTSSELEYVSAEDFDKTMLEKILPKCVEEKDINFYDLLEIDYYWVLRCLRIMNYGPYTEVNRIFCPDCGNIIDGDFQCNLEAVDCVPLPEKFTGTIKISRDEFIEFNGNISLHLLTEKEALNAEQDESFTVNGEHDSNLARMCYMITSFGDTSNVAPLEMKLAIEKNMTTADYQILKALVRDKTDYGLRSTGHCKCTKCGSNNAMFLVTINDRFFRPTLASLRAWKADRDRGKEDDSNGSTEEETRKHNRRSSVHSES